MSARHVETSRKPSPQQENGEHHMQLAGAQLAPCDHRTSAETWMPCCHGGHGRHVAIPRHPVRWPSSSQAGLASFRDAWANDPDRTTRRETFA